MSLTCGALSDNPVCTSLRRLAIPHLQTRLALQGVIPLAPRQGRHPPLARAAQRRVVVAEAEETRRRVLKLRHRALTMSVQVPLMNTTELQVKTQRPCCPLSPPQNPTWRARHDRDCGIILARPKASGTAGEMAHAKPARSH